MKRIRVEDRIINIDNYDNIIFNDIDKKINFTKELESKNVNLELVYIGNDEKHFRNDLQQLKRFMQTGQEYRSLHGKYVINTVAKVENR